MTIAAPMRIPRRITFGNHMATHISQLVVGASNFGRVGVDNPNKSLRRVLGFPLPEWQRGREWSDEQRERFIISIFTGIHLGTFVYNESTNNLALDGLLIDGQQRLFAIEDYVAGQFPVTGEDGKKYHYPELTDAEQRNFLRMQFGFYVVQYDKPEQVARLYNLLNFGGTAHQPGQEAQV